MEYKPELSIYVKFISGNSCVVYKKVFHLQCTNKLIH